MDLIKVLFRNHNALGDILMMTAAVRDFKRQYPQYLIDVDTKCMHLWDNNPNLSQYQGDPELIINLGPKRAVQGSNTSGLHYTNGYRLSIEQNLNLPIVQGHIKPDLHLTEVEKKERWIDGRYWILIAGEKQDFTAKIWEPTRWQTVVSMLKDITFVQLGHGGEEHPRLKGPNVINLIGQTQDPLTGLRDLMKLFYHCDGSTGLVSMHAHMAAAFDRPAVVVAGAREPTSFEQYNHHRYLSNQGAMRCRNFCDNCTWYEKEGKKQYCKAHDTAILGDYIHNKKVCDKYDPINPRKIFIQACWKKSLGGCPNKVKGYPACLMNITANDVAQAIDNYYLFGAMPKPERLAKVNVPEKVYQKAYVTPKNKPIFRMVCNAHAFIGGERSTTWILNNMEKEGYHVQLCHIKGVCQEFKRALSPSVEITREITSHCDIFMIYANDLAYRFNDENWKALMPQVKAERKIMMVNYKMGGVGKVEWTKCFDLYGFLSSTMKDEFLGLMPEDVSYFVLPPAVDIEPFLALTPKYNQTLHIVRHSSQGDKKHPEDTEMMIKMIREHTSESTVFSFMPAPSFLPDLPKVHKYSINQIPVTGFLQKGSCFWYRLPEGYTDQGPRTIVEAMAAGLPVMADNRWGAKDRITPDTGWLCECGEDYIKAVEEITPKILSEKGLAAKERARKEFDPHNWIKMITDKF